MVFKWADKKENNKRGKQINDVIRLYHDVIFWGGGEGGGWSLIFTCINYVSLQKDFSLHMGSIAKMASVCEK